MFDRAVEGSARAQAPPVLYHYTSWQGAEGILKTNTIWATSHDCTNDPAEIVAADETILKVARELRDGVKGPSSRDVLTKFIDNYPGLHVAKMVQIYLACFSVARDDRNQWCAYADHGRGVALGLRVLDELPPRNPH